MRDHSVSRFRLLFALYALGARTAASLAKPSDAARPPVSGLLHSLEPAGSVRRREHPDDGRASLLTLTALGERTAGAAARARNDFESRLLSHLEPSEREQLARLLIKALDAVAGAEPV